MKISLPCSVIVFTCDKIFNRVAEMQKEFLSRTEPPAETKTIQVLQTKGWWLWKKTFTESQVVPTTQAEKDIEIEINRQRREFTAARMFSAPQQLRKLRAIAAHLKPNTMLPLEDPELDLIAVDLAPSEVFAQGDYSERI